MTTRKKPRHTPAQSTKKKPGLPTGKQPKDWSEKRRKSREVLDKTRFGLTLGVLPDAQHITRQTDHFRRSLEQLVSENGELGPREAGKIQTAVRWERHCRLLQKRLSKSLESLPSKECISLSKEIALASTKRDRAIEGLKIDQEEMKDLDFGMEDEDDDDQD